MKTLFVLFLAVSGLLILSSNQRDIRIDYNSSVCQTNRFPFGGPGPFMNCGTENPLGDILCAGCHGHNPQFDEQGNTISYENVLEGSAMNIFRVLEGSEPVTDYIPGNEYTIELSLSNATERKGFDVVLCSETGDMGSFEALPEQQGVQVYSGSDVVFATHSINTGIDVWRWKWTAPMQDPGPVTFNILTLLRVDIQSPSSASFGIYVSQVELTPASASATVTTPVDEINIWKDPADESLVMQSNHAIPDAPLEVELFTVSGTKVQSMKILETAQLEPGIRIPIHVPQGTYILRVSTKNGLMVNKKMFL